MDRRLPTLSDVARRAGVSYATADRVVNERGGVAEKSAGRVRRAVAELRYVRNVAAANLSRSRTYRFAFVVPSGPNAFFAKMRGILRAERDRLRACGVDLRLEDVAAFDATALADRLAELGAEGLDGVALVGRDDPRLAATMAGMRARGVAVVTLVSDTAPDARDAYIGIDNGVAGRTAGRLIGLAHAGGAGRVLPVAGDSTAPDHAQRLQGLRAVLARHYPRLSVAPVIEARDRHDLVETSLRTALAADPGITAIYSAGAGNSGLIRVLEARRRSDRRPVVVLHELVAHSRRALEDGTIDVVIDQRPGTEVTRALRVMRRVADRLPAGADGPVVPALHVRENLPPDAGPARSGAPRRGRQAPDAAGARTAEAAMDRSIDMAEKGDGR